MALVDRRLTFIPVVLANLSGGINLLTKEANTSKDCRSVESKPKNRLSSLVLPTYMFTTTIKIVKAVETPIVFTKECMLNCVVYQASGHTFFRNTLMVSSLRSASNHKVNSNGKIKRNMKRKDICTNRVPRA